MSCLGSAVPTWTPFVVPFLDLLWILGRIYGTEPPTGATNGSSAAEQLWALKLIIPGDFGRCLGGLVRCCVDHLASERKGRSALY